MHGNFKHGYTYKDRIYRIWRNMKTRCYNINHERYYCYGGKGVVVCDEWKDNFINFKEWAFSNGYNDSLTIDRIDSDGNYEPSNCRWISKSLNNEYSNHTGEKYKAISPDGNVYILDEYCHFCEQHGLNKGNVCSMIRGKNNVKSVKGWKFSVIA